MVESKDSLDYIPELSISNDVQTIPLFCWADVSLSTIWLPSNLLKNRYEPQTAQGTRGIFHTLKKNDSSRCVASFSVYENSDEEIFNSDDEDFLNIDIDKQNTATKCLKTENMLSVCNRNFPSNENNTDKAIENDKASQNKYASSQNYNIVKEVNSDESSVNLSHSNSQIYNQTQLRKVESHVSLNEILDDTPEFNIEDYNLNLNTQNQFSGTQNKASNQKTKKGKKTIGLDEFLSDYTQQDFQDACCQDYFNKLSANPNNDENVRIRNIAEFPGLEQNKIKFFHSEKPKIPDSQFSLKSCAEMINTSERINEGITSLVSCRKIVIENIPDETSKEDIQSLLCGYGKINSFKLEPIGKFLTATVEIELESDMDWIIECLNGSEPFGASTCSLNCYEKP